MRCARPSTTAVFPTPARPTSAACSSLAAAGYPRRARSRRRRHRTGSRSPRRACAVRSIPTRSSTSPESNSPSKRITHLSVAFEKMSVPGMIASPTERYPRTNSEEYTERHQSLLLDRQWNEMSDPRRCTREHGEQSRAPPDESCAIAQSFLRSPPPIASSLKTHVRHPRRARATRPDRRAEQRLQEAIHAAAECEEQPDDEPTPRKLVRDDVVACIGDRMRAAACPNSAAADARERHATPAARHEPIRRPAPRSAEYCFEMG